MQQILQEVLQQYDHVFHSCADAIEYTDGRIRRDSLRPNANALPGHRILMRVARTMSEHSRLQPNNCPLVVLEIQDPDHFSPRVVAFAQRSY
jgi:hypothetical protein